MNEIKIKNVNEVIYEHTLKNGLRIFIWKYDKVNDISLSLTVKYGSIHTKFKVKNKTIKVPNGLAHFLEHIKFNEKGGSAHDYFYKIGSYTNAYTTYDHTSYEVMCNNNLKDNLNHLLFFVNNPYFNKKMISKEKPIIIEESKMTLDNPYNLGYKHLMNLLYHNDNHRYLITGEKDDINSITLEDILNVYDNFYVPSNMFLTVTGNVNPYEVVKICEDFYENDNLKKDIPKIINEEEKKDVVSKYEEITTVVSKEKVLYGIKIPKNKLNSYDDLHLRILFNILLDINMGSTSDFYEQLVNDGLIDDISFMTNVEKNYVIIILELSTSYPKEVIKKINDKIKNIALNKDDFIRKNKVCIASTILGYEDSYEVGNDIRNDIIKYNKIIDNIYDVFNFLKPNDVLKLVDVIKTSPYSIVVLKPNKK